MTKRDDTVHYYLVENHRASRVKSYNFLDLIPLFAAFALKNVHVLKGRRFYKTSKIDAKFVYENNHVVLKHRLR